jgi:hypothetical protein
MDHKTNKQKPSGTEGGEMKIGDAVWVLCEVLESEYQGCVKCSNHNYVLNPYVEEIRPVEPSNCPEIPDSSSDPLAPSPCMDGVDVDQFIEGVMEARGRADFKVGDAVRFVSPGHNRHGTEGILKSIHHGPKNAYLFVSDCGQFHRYCTIAELEHYDKAETVDVKGSMQSLDGADTIQAGDLQWTDRDGKYRLCNFTIGMRVHEAIQRGKAHGEKWVFYRKFREAGE